MAHAIELPAVDPFVAPLLYAIPVQLLAHHAAVPKGTDVDQPCTLAKSVTVEKRRHGPRYRRRRVTRGPVPC